MAETKYSWTEAQGRAIEERGRNLLVAASAGTGKTAVLVERCIRLVTDPSDPVDIDRLLVVTFTDLAAAEMRNRIAEALRARLEESPADTRLRRQLVLLDRASISTLHAFALRTLQEHFFRLDLDPLLSVMDADEADLLRHETLDEVFELLYSKAGPDGDRFRGLVDRYGPRGDDRGVRYAVLSLSDFLRSLPDPEARRERILAAYAAATPDCRFEDLCEWYEPFAEAVRDNLMQLDARANESLAPAPGGETLPEVYARRFRGLGESFAGMRRRFESRGYDELQRAVAEFKYSRLPTVKGIHDSVRERAKSLNDEIRKSFHELQEVWCAVPGEAWAGTIRNTRPAVEALLEVVGLFDEAFQRAKRERGALDFQDLERMCYRLLVDREGGKTEPSETALELRDFYDYVLVDEYQDINPLQDEILRMVSRQDEDGRAANLFMVGDVKQSIYRFRLADPGIFQAKFDAYEPDAEPGADLRVDLNENFRSRGALLGAVNSLFRSIMVREVGGIAYDDAAELRGGFDYPEAPKGGPPALTGLPVEVHFFDRTRASDAGPDGGADEADEETPDELEQIEIEASWVAERIRAMVGGGPERKAPEFSVWDGGAKKYRPVAYSDVAILLLTAAHKADDFVRVLGSYDIPAYTDAGGGCLRSTEMMDMFALLESLDNPHQDIPVAAILRSPLVGLSESELAALRIHTREGDFFLAVKAYAEGGPDETLRERLTDFLESIELWRTMVRHGPLAPALWTIYNETGYLDYVAAMDNGAQRRANLIGLYDRARQFDEFSRRGLGRFLEFVRQVEENEGDLGGPPAISEAENVVRVMSIHKSKGLEFPVVFVPDIGKAFNFESTRGDLVIDTTYGVGLREIVPERAVKFRSAAHLVVSRRIEREMRAEQLRLLYVAATRAREKLLFCGSITKPPEEKWAAFVAEGKGAPGPIDAVTLASARSFADWVGPALARLGYLGGGGAGEYAVTFHSSEECAEYRPRRGPQEDRDETIRRVAAMEPVAVPKSGQKVAAAAMARLEWQYLWRGLAEVRGKTTVTEMKRAFEAAAEEDELVPEHLARQPIRRPAFLVEGEPAWLTASEIGTATHAVLQHLDLAQPLDPEGIRWQIEEMRSRGTLSPAEAEAVDIEAIANLFQSPLGKALQANPSHVQREVPFSIALRAEEVEPGLAAGAGDAEWVHLQGTIDCLIERKAGYAIVDYKTDRIDAGEVAERAEAYRTQLDLYARAVETIFGRPVPERMLYFLHPGVAFMLSS